MSWDMILIRSGDFSDFLTIGGKLLVWAVIIFVVGYILYRIISTLWKWVSDIQYKHWLKQEKIRQYELLGVGKLAFDGEYRVHCFIGGNYPSLVVVDDDYETDCVIKTKLLRAINLVKYRDKNGKEIKPEYIKNAEKISVIGNTIEVLECKT